MALSLVVPTVGRSGLLAECLEALRRDAGGGAEIVVVAQGEAAERDFGGWADRVIRVPQRLGFTAANNLGFRATSGEYVGTINDDAVVEPGFCARLCALLDARPAAAAVQGLNLQARDPSKVDGGGIGWNAWWQAVQLGLGEEAAAMPGEPVEIFGASATAAIYRRSALERVALPGGQYFAEQLFTYYEDVELAARLRGAGFEAWLEPRARARHAGSASLSTLRFAGRTLIHGNRLPVVAGMLGGEFWPRLPKLLLREARDLARLALRGELAGAWAVLLGLGRGARLLPSFARRGAPVWPLERLAAARLPGQEGGPKRMGPSGAAMKTHHFDPKEGPIPSGGPGREPPSGGPGGEPPSNGFFPLSVRGERGRGERSESLAPLLAGVVVHWKNEEELAELVAAWPADPRAELVVVDNSGTLPKERPAEWQGKARLLDPGGNRGFGGGVNAGVAATAAEWVLILNPDAKPLPGAIEILLAAAGESAAAGLVPALEWPDGRSQCEWQLQPLPSASTLLLQVFFLAGQRGPKEEPPAGTPIAQPAAAVLALRRAALEELGGFDEEFFPAWFEDVDLARRLEQRGHRCLYLPRSRFVHSAGGSLPALGYGPFLFVYYRNLCRYLAKHHGRAAAAAARVLLPFSMLLRLLLLPLRKPNRAISRREAARGLLAVATGALTGFRRPRAFAERFAKPPA